MPISYTTILKPGNPTYTKTSVVSAPTYTELLEVTENIMDESGANILDEASNPLRSEQRQNIFTTVVKPA